jgi:hypothetical protein
MEALVNQPQRWLKYVDAGDLDGTSVDFDGMDVESPLGEHLGDVDGFIVDSDTSRPYYVVVEAGGWFKSKHYLLPVGHARLDIADDGEAFVADLTRDRVEQFPGFDKDQFDKLSEKDVKQLNDQICIVCSADTSASYDANEPYSAAWSRPSYKHPDWWSATPTNPDRMAESAVTSGAAYTATKSPNSTYDPAPGKADDRRAEKAARAATDESPHFAGRAQPGDVLGIETGGEQTHVGETAEDEDKRRETAQKSAAKEPSPTRH